MGQEKAAGTKRRRCISRGKVGRPISLELGVAELAQDQGMCGCREGVVAAFNHTHKTGGLIGARVGSVDARMICWDGVRQLLDCAFQLFNSGRLGRRIRE